LIKPGYTFQLYSYHQPLSTVTCQAMYVICVLGSHIHNLTYSTRHVIVDKA
jgi:hypothetical protein